jgi:hypothetical protein
MPLINIIIYNNYSLLNLARPITSHFSDELRCRIRDCNKSVFEYNPSQK